MFKHAILALAAFTVVSCHERQERRHKYEDPFTLLDKHLSHSLSFHYAWPWSQLFSQAAAALDLEGSLEQPKIVSDDKKYEVSMTVTNFKPEELKIKVKEKNMVVEGKHIQKNDEGKQFVANHFVQRFVLPLGTRGEEVTAVLKENVLVISVPKHEVPPPPPEREVPIQVVMTEEKTEKVEVETTTEKKVEMAETTTEKKVELPTSSSTPLEQLELVEATTHVGKIRKKELKEPAKTAKDNEVTKGLDGNGLDYALIETE